MLNKLIRRSACLAITLVLCGTAWGYSHSNRYGGSTSHSYGSTSHTSAYGTSTSHTYGEGSSHTNYYGGSTSHSAYGGTTHTNIYGGTTSGKAGYGAVHTTPYGTKSYASAYHPPTAYYGYHPHTTVGYYGATCYHCSSGSTAGAAAVGAGVGVAVGAAAASSENAAASQNAYAQGYSAGDAYEMGEIYGALPSGCITPSVADGGTYYLCGNTWFVPSYGANGVYYRVVPAP
jgi:hypothetical protein